MSLSDRKRKFLTFKYQSLRKEREECDSIMSLITQEVYDLYSKNFKGNSPAKDQNDERSAQLAQFVPQEQFKKPDENKKNPQDPEIKKVFRRIALKIHPDKLINCTKKEKQEKIKLYQKATLAAENNDLLTLSEIAIGLGLTPPAFSQQATEFIEEKIKTLKKEIESIQSTLMWNWYFTEKKELKDKILKKLFEIIHEKRK